MKRRDILTAAAAFAAGINPVTNRGFAEVRQGENRRNSPLEAQGLRIRDVQKILAAGERFNTQPVLREEILDNPGAVFLVKAGVRTSRDGNGKLRPVPDQMERLGRRLTRLLFQKGTESGGRTFLKPNFVGGLNKNRPVDICHGGIVHPYLVAGMTDGLHMLGNTNVAIGARGALRRPQVLESGLEDLLRTHNLPMIEAHVQYYTDYDTSELFWHDSPEGIVQKRYATYRPVYETTTTFINVAHAHTHWVAHLTLTMKNLQGIMPRGYGHICDDWTSLSLWRADLMDDFNRGYRPEIEAHYLRHANDGFKHWDVGGAYKTYRAAGGYEAFLAAYETYRSSRGAARDRALERLYEIAGHRLFLTEIWAQRMMDIVTTIPSPYVSIVDGVFSRGQDAGIVHTDFLTVGRDMMAVDVVTSWMMGHEPRELPFLRIASERGVGSNDIERIPLYRLDEEGVHRIPDYRDLPRFRLGTGIYSLPDEGVFYF